MRPSRICARFTPRRTASTQQSIFGIMPPLMIPWFLRLGTSLTLTTGIRVFSSSLSAQQAADIRHQDELDRVQFCRNARRRDVGVDVEHLAVHRPPATVEMIGT